MKSHDLETPDVFVSCVHLSGEESAQSHISSMAMIQMDTLEEDSMMRKTYRQVEEKTFKWLREKPEDMMNGI